MPERLNSLTFKIGIIIIVAEAIVLVIAGFIYIERFSDTIDQRLEEQVTLPAILMNRGLLSIASLAEQNTMQQLVGESLIEGWAVDPDGYIFASFNPDYRGLNIADLSEIDTGLFDFENPQTRVESGSDHISSITPIYRGDDLEPRLFIYIKVGTSEAQQEKANIRALFFIGSIITLVLTSIIIILSFRNIIFKRLNDTLTILKQIESGDLTARSKGDLSQDELGLLQQRVDSTVATLERRNQERERAEAERIEHERVLNLLQKEQEWNTSIQRMMKVFSHELKTPLAVIQTSSDTLMRYMDRLTPERKQEKLATITSQVQYMVAILDDVVQVVQNIFQRDNFRPELINIEQICRVTINELQESIGSKHKLIFVTDERIKTIHADETLITRILINLLSNAIKYSPEDSEIRLELRDKGGEGISIAVIDRGMGISEDDQKHIFDSFFRTDNVGDIPGTGLGLNIVRDCVKLHEGEIRVESEPGVGSTFEVLLPRLEDSE